MSSGYEIAKEKDIRELYDLQLRAFESEAEMIGSRNVPALMESLEENRADFRNWTVLVKRNDEGRIIGAVRFREESDHIEIGRVMVAQEYRNRGILRYEDYVKNEEYRHCSSSDLRQRRLLKYTVVLFSSQFGELIV